MVYRTLAWRTVGWFVLVAALVPARGICAQPSSPEIDWHAGVRVLLERGDPAAALAADDVLRSLRAFRSFASQGADVFAGLPPDLAAEQAKLDAERAVAATKLLRAYDEAEVRSQLGAIEQLLARQADLSRRAGKGTRSSRLPFRESVPLTAARIVEIAGEGTLTIVFINVGESIVPIAITPDGEVVAGKPAPIGPLNDTVTAYLVAPPREQRPKAVAIAQRLPLADFASALGAARRVLIIPDSPLFLAPMPALEVPGLEGPIGAARALRFGVSLSQVAAAEGLSRQVPAPWSILYDPVFPGPTDIGRYVYIPTERGGDSYVHGVGPPTDGGERSTLGAHLSKRGCSFARLPWGGREAAALREARGADHVVAAQGVLATEGAARAALHDAGYVYMSTYAVLDDEFPALSLLALSPSTARGAGDKPEGDQRESHLAADGLLTAEELLSVDARAGLISIGHTLRVAGDTPRGDGLVALIWAFTCAGVPSVTIAAPGTPDDPDARFAKALFPALAAGAAPDEAVRSALAQTSLAGSEGLPPVHMIYGRGEAAT